jgi:hypothetical protein
MKHWTRRALFLAVSAMLVASLAATADDDDDKPAPSGAAPALTAEQRHAVGIEVSRPVAAQAPARTDAIGTVLDRAALLAEDSEALVTSAQARAAAAELARLHELYRGGAGASLKMVEAAEAEDEKARADSRAAAMRFAQHWGPLTAQSPADRRKIIDAVGSGRAVLVRADLAGRHTVGALPAKAIVDVDGIEMPGRVIGALEQPSELQSAGLLIEISHAPPGLSPGARIAVTLLSEDRAGFLLPKGALLYGESGPYVYKQIAPKTPKDKVQYVPVKVTAIAPSGDGWLVKGVDDDDDIVVHGAGVLWSLEGMGTHPVDDDDD